MPMGTSRTGLFARVIYSAATNASGSNTISWTVDYSPDGGTTWYSGIATSETIALSTTAASGEVYIPFITPIDGAVKSTVQVRLSVVVAGAGSTPTVTYQGDCGHAMP